MATSDAAVPVWDGERVQVALRCKHELGEGAIWVAALQKFVHVDIYGPSGLGEGPAVYVHDPYAAAGAGTLTRYPVPSFCGTVVPRSGGGFLVALKDGVYALSTPDGSVTKLVDPEGIPTNRFNDGKCGPDGRLWVGTMGAPGMVHPKVGGLYRVEAVPAASEAAPEGAEASGGAAAAAAPSAVMHRATKVLGDVTISNGLTWSADGRTFYYTDTPTGHVKAFDYDATTGSISNERIAVQIPAGTGHPDGCCLAIAPDGHETLWVAQWDGWRVVCYDLRTGAVERIVKLPAEKCSSCAFGGPGMDDLYITTAQEHLDAAGRAAQPEAGNIFMVRGTGYRGIPAYEYRG